MLVLKNKSFCSNFGASTYNDATDLLLNELTQIKKGGGRDSCSSNSSSTSINRNHCAKVLRDGSAPASRGLTNSASKIVLYGSSKSSRDCKVTKILERELPVEPLNNSKDEGHLASDSNS